MRPIEISSDEFTFDSTDSASVRWVHASEAPTKNPVRTQWNITSTMKRLTVDLVTPWMRFRRTALISPWLAIWLTA